MLAAVLLASAIGALPIQEAHLERIDGALLMLRVVKPFGCYRTALSVQNPDAFTHVLVPVLAADAVDPCIPYTGVDYLTVDLGPLAAGPHHAQVEANGLIFAELSFTVP